MQMLLSLDKSDLSNSEKNREKNGFLVIKKVILQLKKQNFQRTPWSIVTKVQFQP